MSGFTGNMPPGVGAPAEARTPASGKDVELSNTPAVVSRRNAAIEWERSRAKSRFLAEDPEAGEPAEPAEPPPEASPEAQPAAEPQEPTPENHLPRPDELPALIQKRKAERLERERVEAERLELAQLRQQIGQPNVLTDQAFEAMTPEQRRTTLKRLVELVQKGDKPDEIGQIRENVQSLQQAEQQRQVRAAQAARDANVNAFHTLAASAKKNEDGTETAQWPLAASLSPDDRLQKAGRIVAQYREAEVPISDAQILDLIEEEEAARFDKLAALRGQPSGAPAAPQNPAEPPGPPGTPPSDSPTTLSNAHAATAAHQGPPTTMAERRELAIQHERRKKRAREGW